MTQADWTAASRPASTWNAVCKETREPLTWHAFVKRQRARLFSERWRIGVVNAPLSAWLAPDFVPDIRWITPQEGHRYRADPVAMPGTGALFCEEFNELTGIGRLVRLRLNAQEQVIGSEVHALQDNSHVSFPQLLQDQGRVLGLLESSASRTCVLYNVNVHGLWQRRCALLDDVSAIDPTLFVHEGRYWLAYTDGDLGEHDNLCLRHADTLDGPWVPHPKNPVQMGLCGSRMAGAFFTHEGALYRPAQDCQNAYGAGLFIHRVTRCSPTEYREEVVRHFLPDPKGPCPDGLHTLAAWGERTLVDGKRMSLSPWTLRRKLQARWAGRAREDAHAQAKASGKTQLAHIAVVVPHLRMGGGELSMLRVASGLARLGVKVDLIVNTLRTAEIDVPPSLNLIELSKEGTLSAVRALADTLQRTKPQLVFSAFPHTNVAVVWAVRQAGVGVRCVVSEHAPLSLQIKREAGWRYRILPPLVKWAYRRADAVVAVSRGVATDLQTMLGSRRAVSVIANPVLDDHEALDTLPAPDHPWLNTPALRVLMSVSRLSVEKDIPTLIKAFAQVHAAQPDTRLLLLGEGPDRPRLEALVRELGLSQVVQLPGRVTQPRRWMKHAAVFALASQYEGFGNVLIEAMSCGVPVVSTDCPVGPRDILCDGRFGQLVPVGDWQAMARAMAIVLARSNAPLEAQTHAQGFTQSQSSLAYFQLFQSLL